MCREVAAVVDISFAFPWRQRFELFTGIVRRSLPFSSSLPSTVDYDTSLHNQDTQRSHNTRGRKSKLQCDSLIFLFFIMLLAVRADYFICASYYSLLTRFGIVMIAAFQPCYTVHQHGSARGKSYVCIFKTSKWRFSMKCYEALGVLAGARNWFSTVSSRRTIRVRRYRNRKAVTWTSFVLPQTWARTSFYWLLASIDKTPALDRGPRNRRFTTF